MEETMITLMKEACGYEFTSKFQRMLTDMNISQQLSANFAQELAKNGKTLEVPMSVMILQAGAWPLSASANNRDSSTTASPDCGDASNYVPPAMFLDSLKLFEDFYSNSHSGRKLAWLFGNQLSIQGLCSCI